MMRLLFSASSIVLPIGMRENAFMKHVRDDKDSSARIFQHFYDNQDKNRIRSRRYNYSGVDGWGKMVPGQNIFNLKRPFIPINEGNVHIGHWQ